MRVQCAIRGSTLGSGLLGPDGRPLFPLGLAPALTESPLRALQGNQDLPLFYGIAAQGASPAPALVKFSCEGPSGDPVTDVLNYFQYTVGHSWTAKQDRDVVGDRLDVYEQTDTLDGSTLLPIDAKIVQNTFPPGFLPDPPLWNNGVGYTYDSTHTYYLSSSGGGWDPGSTRAQLIAALASVDFNQLWKNGTTDPNNPNVFTFDRCAIDPQQFGALPFGGSAVPGGTCSGNLIPSNAQLGPSIVGRIAAGARIAITAATTGLFLSRVQIQVRNFAGVAPLDYFFVEQWNTAASVTIQSNNVKQSNFSELNDLNTFFRMVGNGLWTKDLQIVELPQPTIDLPFRTSTPLGDRAVFSAETFMVVGATFEQWMFSQAGPNWRNFVI